MIRPISRRASATSSPPSTPQQPGLLADAPTPVNLMPTLLNAYLGPSSRPRPTAISPRRGFRELMELTEVPDPDAGRTLGGMRLLLVVPAASAPGRRRHEAGRDADPDPRLPLGRADGAAAHRRGPAGLGSPLTPALSRPARFGLRGDPGRPCSRHSRHALLYPGLLLGVSGDAAVFTVVGSRIAAGGVHYLRDLGPQAARHVPHRCRDREPSGAALAGHLSSPPLPRWRNRLVRVSGRG